MPKIDTCLYHPSREALGWCSVCRTPLCEDCRLQVEGVSYCPSDAEKELSIRPSNIVRETLPQEPDVPPEFEDQGVEYGERALPLFARMATTGGPRAASWAFYSGALSFLTLGGEGLALTRVLLWTYNVPGSLPVWRALSPFLVFLIVCLAVGILLGFAGRAAASGVRGAGGFGISVAAFAVGWSILAAMLFRSGGFVVFGVAPAMGLAYLSIYRRGSVRRSRPSIGSAGRSSSLSLR